KWLQRTPPREFVLNPIFTLCPGSEVRWIKREAVIARSPPGDAAISGRLGVPSTRLLRCARNDEPLFDLKNFAFTILAHDAISLHCYVSSPRRRGPRAGDVRLPLAPVSAGATVQFD